MPDLTSIRAALNVLAVIFLASFAWSAGQGAWALIKTELWRIIVIIIIIIIIIIIVFGVIK